MTILVVTGIAAGAALALSWFSDQSARLDSEFLRLKRQAGTTTLPPDSTLTTRQGHILTWTGDLFPKAEAPPLTDLVALFQAEARNVGLVLADLRMTDTSQATRLKVSLQGDALRWLALLEALRREVPQVVFDTVSLNLTDRGDYRIEMEVGYGQVP